MSEQLKNFCPCCHTSGDVEAVQQLSHDEDSDPGYAWVVKCHQCGYQTIQRISEEVAIKDHNANVEQMKALFVEVWNLAIRHANHPERDPEADEYEQWLKSKGIE
jgi:hypothetical protein